jgi:hypothetical protein
LLCIFFEKSDKIGNMTETIFDDHVAVNMDEILANDIGVDDLGDWEARTLEEMQKGDMPKTRKQEKVRIKNPLRQQIM